jgi:hypothetical protein
VEKEAYFEGIFYFVLTKRFCANIIKIVKIHHAMIVFTGRKQTENQRAEQLWKAHRGKTF